MCLLSRACQKRSGRTQFGAFNWPQPFRRHSAPIHNNADGNPNCMNRSIVFKDRERSFFSFFFNKRNLHIFITLSIENKYVNFHLVHYQSFTQ